MRTIFPLAERVAIAELVTAAEMCAGSRDFAVQVVAALLAERAAKIIRGTATPHDMTAQEIQAFVKAWRADVPAVFTTTERTKEARDGG